MGGHRCNEWKHMKTMIRQLQERLDKEKKNNEAGIKSLEQLLILWKSLLQLGSVFQSLAVLTDNNSHIVFCWQCGDIIEKISDREKKKKKKKNTSGQTYLEEKNRTRKTVYRLPGLVLTFHTCHSCAHTQIPNKMMDSWQYFICISQTYTQLILIHKRLNSLPVSPKMTHCISVQTTNNTMDFTKCRRLLCAAAGPAAK